jgi:penicillin amidase
VSAPVTILRDGRGVPHVFASNDHDLFVAYGYVMGQDRLFQMDLRRRRAVGRLAEVLGEAGVEADVLARTIDLPRLADAEFGRLPVETRALFEAFADGVNAAIRAGGGRLAIEFDLLGYAPEAWTALDCVRCVASWRWQLTGRPWVISVPEVAKRLLDGPLYDAFIAYQRERDDESIVPAGGSTARDVPLIPVPSAAGARAGSAAAAGAASPAGSAASTPRVPEAAGAPSFTDGLGGSNNWVVAGARSKSGKPIVASDPHMPYEAQSSFYEIHLSGGSFEVAGAGFIGYPALTFGRTRHLGWAITNNLCSQRDLYFETDPDAVTASRDETIAVRGRAEPIQLTVQHTSHGPIIDGILPRTAAPTGPVALRWVGQLDCDWPSALLRLNRAQSIDEGMAAVRGWLSPTFSMLLADDDGPSGHIAFTNTGTIPVRGRLERGFRVASDPENEWLGIVAPEGMPQTRDPQVGWLGSANNRPVMDAEFPHPLGGTWDEGIRHRRIGQLAEGLTPHDLSTFSQMHSDVHVLRADDQLETVVSTLAAAGGLTPDETHALDLLRAWDHNASVDSAAAAIWEIFWTRWVQAVSAVRFAPESADFISNWMVGFSGHMLRGDDVGWFVSEADRRATVLAAFREALGEMSGALGPDQSAWRWGALHHIGLRHPLGSVGDLGQLLDQPLPETPSDIAALNNRGAAGTRIPADDPAYIRNWESTSGAGYRLVADLGDPNGSAWTITLEGQSGNPVSPHRTDQQADFLAGRYHEIPLDRARVEAAATQRLVLTPDGTVRG